MVSGTRSIWLTAGLTAVAALAACGGNLDGSGPNPETVSVAPAEPSGNAQSADAGADLPNPLRIMVVRGGAPTAGVVVTWNATGTGASMTPTVDTTGADGISTSLWHLGSEPGQQSARATVAGAGSGSPVAFSAIARARDTVPTPVTAQLLSGNNQSDTAGRVLPNPLRIVVVRGGAPAAGAVVTWSAAGTGASMTPRVDTTGADGISASVWHLGIESGQQSAQATVLGAAGGSPVFFSAIALAPVAPPAEVTIRLLSAGGNRFDPANLNIAAGTRVTWTWADGFHNVVHEVLTGGNRGFASSGDPVSPPRSYSFTFATPGVYNYFCEVHGTLTTGMHGTITVQ